MLIIRVSYVTAALLTVVKIGIIAKYPLKLHIWTCAVCDQIENSDQTGTRLDWGSSWPEPDSTKLAGFLQDLKNFNTQLTGHKHEYGRL